ncbi:phytanoyl-CoA dioxygenase family protein [Burkholderia diffusa]|uniref:phytanoyl-CoA dioxygenase family protein n=1 Tax=Burkholderia diffusa TaxID=488732 RepID=UPI0018C8A8DC|nr:phytanoyl-CoA dioxygenase family protein [Burkholderia diffusa]
MLTQEELSQLRALIRARWLAHLLAVCPREASRFAERPMAQYHELAHLIDHATVWTKAARLFAPEEVEQIGAMSVFAALRERWGAVEIADIEGLGYPETYWRLVRPNSPEDVAGVHADAWFYRHTNGLSDTQQAGLVKLWLAVDVEPGVSGLALMPDSHRRAWPYRVEVRHGRMKPVFDADPAQLALTRVEACPGEAIVFHPHLLHQGLAHCSTRSRISVECAVRVAGGRFA